MTVAICWLGYVGFKVVASVLDTLLGLYPKRKLVYCICHGNTQYLNQSRVTVCMEKSYPFESMEVQATFVEAPWIKTLYVTDLAYIMNKEGPNLKMMYHVGKMRGFRRIPDYEDIIDEMKRHLSPNKYEEWSIVLQWNMKRVLARVARLYRRHELNKKND